MTETPPYPLANWTSQFLCEHYWLQLPAIESYVVNSFKMIQKMVTAMRVKGDQRGEQRPERGEWVCKGHFLTCNISWSHPDSTVNRFVLHIIWELSWNSISPSCGYLEFIMTSGSYFNSVTNLSSMFNGSVTSTWFVAQPVYSKWMILVRSKMFGKA